MLSTELRSKKLDDGLDESLTVIVGDRTQKKNSVQIGAY